MTSELAVFGLSRSIAWIPRNTVRPTGVSCTERDGLVVQFGWKENQSATITHLVHLYGVRHILELRPVVVHILNVNRDWQKSILLQNERKACDQSGELEISGGLSSLCNRRRANSCILFDERMQSIWKGPGRERFREDTKRVL